MSLWMYLYFYHTQKVLGNIMCIFSQCFNWEVLILSKNNVFSEKQILECFLSWYMETGEIFSVI